MIVKLATEPCLLCSTKENTVHAKGKTFQMVVCPKHLIELLKKEVPSEAGAAIPAKV